MATNKIAIRQDTAANWTSENPTLDDGELGHESGTGRTKIGDGSTAWNSLNYIDTLPRGATQIDDGDSPYTILQTDLVIYVDASGGAVTVTLPSLSSNLGRKITVRAKDATNTITVARAGSDTIANALTSVTLSSDRDYWTLEAGPDQWELVAGYETGHGLTGTYTKHHDGTMICLVGFSGDVEIVTAFAGGFRSTGTIVIVLPATFINDQFTVSLSNAAESDAASVLEQRANRTVSAIRPIWTAFSSQSSATRYFNADVIGRWY